MIRIQLMADNSQAEAERLLREGGEVRSYEVLQRLLPMIFDTVHGKALRDNVVFWRISSSGDVREFDCVSMGCAIEQHMEVRPSRDIAISISETQDVS